MKHRNPFAIVILSIITLGIYDLYWLSVTRKELNTKTNQKVPTVWLLVSPLLVLVAVVIMQIAARSASSGASTGVNIIFVLLEIGAVIAILVVPMVWFYKFSKAVNEYTNGKMTTAVTFLILWLLHLIGVALVQDAFNDMQSKGQSVVTAAPTQPNSGQPYYPNTPQEQLAATNYSSSSQPAKPAQPAQDSPQPQSSNDGQTTPTAPVSG